MLNQVVSRPIYDLSTLCLDVRSGLIAAALPTMLVATAPEEFGTPECTDTKEAAAYSRTSGESTHLFFLSEPVAFRRVYGFESYYGIRGPAGNRTTTGSLSATQECRDTNCTTRTTSGELTHHWQSVSDTKSAAIPTAPRGRLCLRPYPPQFLKYEHIPLHLPPHNDSAK